MDHCGWVDMGLDLMDAFLWVGMDGSVSYDLGGMDGSGCNVIGGTHIWLYYFLGDALIRYVYTSYGPGSCCLGDMHTWIWILPRYGSYLDMDLDLF